MLEASHGARELRGKDKKASYRAGQVDKKGRRLGQSKATERGEREIKATFQS